MIDWKKCGVKNNKLRFSRQLHPIFDAAAAAMTDHADQIVFGRVDCDREGAICKEFAVNKV